MNPYKKRCEAINKEVPLSKKNDEKAVSNHKAVSPKGKPYLEEDNLDRVFRVFLAVCILYYIADTLFKVIEFA